MKKSLLMSGRTQRRIPEFRIFLSFWRIGEIPESVKEKLQCADSDTLRKYHKLAAKVDSIQAFTEML